jgi:hypothetical protein
MTPWDLRSPRCEWQLRAHAIEAIFAFARKRTLR